MKVDWMVKSLDSDLELNSVRRRVSRMAQMLVVMTAERTARTSGDLTARWMVNKWVDPLELKWVNWSVF